MQLRALSVSPTPETSPATTPTLQSRYRLNSPFSSRSNRPNPRALLWPAAILLTAIPIAFLPGDPNPPKGPQPLLPPAQLPVPNDFDKAPPKKPAAPPKDGLKANAPKKPRWLA